MGIVLMPLERGIKDEKDGCVMEHCACIII
jgi:hypothetical protein